MRTKKGKLLALQQEPPITMSDFRQPIAADESLHEGYAQQTGRVASRLHNLQCVGVQHQYGAVRC